jgi:hypothetical protein
MKIQEEGEKKKEEGMKKEEGIKKTGRNAEGIINKRRKKKNKERG